MDTEMVNWKQREVERARNAAMVKAQQLRELRAKEGEVAERVAHDEHNESTMGRSSAGSKATDVT